MARLTRYVQKVFGESSGANEIAQFGSLAAGTPTFTTNPKTIQALSNYLGGWYDAVISGNSPAIEDMNALFYLAMYQLSYLMQLGIPEWDADTTYYTGSLAQDGAGKLYRSIANNNTNHALTDTSYWLPAGSTLSVTNLDPATNSPKTLTAGDIGKAFDVNTVNGAQTIVLPAAQNGFVFTVKDSGGVASVNNITIQRAASESIEGLAASFLCAANFGVWTFYSDGTNWFLQ